MNLDLWYFISPHKLGRYTSFEGHRNCSLLDFVLFRTRSREDMARELVNLWRQFGSSIELKFQQLSKIKEFFESTCDASSRLEKAMNINTSHLWFKLCNCQKVIKSFSLRLRLLICMTWMFVSISMRYRSVCSALNNASLIFSRLNFFRLKNSVVKSAL